MPAEAIPKINLIPLSEVNEREAKYLLRLADVTTSGELVKKSEKDFHQSEALRVRKEHWEHYLRCDGIPRPYVPVDVRTFIAKIRHFDDIESKGSVSWTLSIDERSILNQNIFRTDKTRDKMRSTKDDPGGHYENDIEKCLETLKQMDTMLDNQAELELMTTKVQYEIMETYSELEEEINQLFNRLTYRIMHMQSAYMITEDNKVATWSHRTGPWQLDLWGLLNVSVLFNQLEIPVMLATFETTGVTVQVPMSMLVDCMTLRSIHTEFDNFSQNAKSFEPPIMSSTNYPNAGILDMQESMINEWIMQQDLQEETLAEMLHRREEYEEVMADIAIRVEQAAKEAKSGNEGKGPKIIIPKAPREPPLVPPNMFPDIYNDFLRIEDSQNTAFLDEVYHPRNLRLFPGEINLRECIIQGGIYSIMFVRRPDQTEFNKFNIVWHEDDRLLHTMPELVAETKRNHHATEMMRRSRATLVTPANAKLEDSDLPFFHVSIQLPPDLCKWSEPEVCHFLTEMQLVPPEPRRTLAEFGASSDQNTRASTADSRSSIRQTTRLSVDSTTNIFRPTIRMMLRHTRYSGIGSISAGLMLKDFTLKDRLLSHLQVRNVERHAIPRIISSFKFPADFLDDLPDVEVSTNKKGLFKRQDAEVVAKRPELGFDYESQLETPERMYPYFPKVEPVQQADSDLEDSDEPQELTLAGTSHTMHQLIEDLNNIKVKYRAKPNELLNQPDEPEKKQPKEKVKEEVVPENTSTPKKDEKEPTPGRRRTKRSTAIRPESEFRGSDKFEEVTHWTTKHIIDLEINKVTHKLTFKTDRLGIFGLAFKRYDHFPFREWSLQPNEENPEEVIFSLDTFHVRILFYISAKGVRGYVTDIIKGYAAKPVKYLEIKEPIVDFKMLRKIFVAKNINIFAEHDASFYITNGYYSMKHVASEQHTYKMMALHCKSMKFYRSSWNRLANRRDIILGMKLAKDNTDYSEVTVRIQPESTTFVTVTENCSDQENVIVLSYKNTWRNIGNFTDLHMAVCSMSPTALESRNKDSLLLFYVKKMLSLSRPLSFS
ncbi:uncharacterized protein Dana_GF10193 [Drosophila ananassae]|uniref:CASC1 C-terminal domain-containing protein n=1 Tax=Drosophila ananassae TaxID=7217 RepID=B3M6V2_DROAN|nr:uncharacterized protein LOC6493067 [Drosophila ananassae]EDV39788.2 uncharacterized protein Dana_GF10193 [Drosophila ananassae]